MIRQTRLRRLIALLALTSFAVAACTTEQQSTPGPTLTTTSTTTTVAPPPTTIAPTTSETTTTESTTTTTTTPTGPTDALVPLLIGAEGQGWLFLGAWQQGAWQKATDPSGNPIRPGIEPGSPFTVSNLDGETAAAVGENVEACFDGRVGPTIDVSVAPPDPPGFGYAAVAILTQPWPLKPRPVAVMAGAPDAYRALGAAAFDAKKVDPSEGDVEQLVVTDLDGDGDDEALAVFEFIQPGAGPGEPGDLAALISIDVTTRAATTVSSTFVAGSASSGSGIIQRYRVLDVADLNGDGVMEVLVLSWYYEGASVIVYAYDGSEFTEVLANGCGA